MTEFATKRIYAPADAADGYRVLVDRLWPRGVSKARAALDEWAKALAPSNELRIWFDHVPERFAGFSRRYRAELRSNPELPACIATWRKHMRVTLLFGARDETRNEAIVLQRYLEGSATTP